MLRSAITCTAISLTLLTGACGNDAKEGSGAQPDPTDAPQTYATQAFEVPFDITVPSWSPGDAAVDDTHYVTWESTADGGPAVRFLLPVSVYQPGATDATPPPADYVTYLLSQQESGAVFSDQSETTVDGNAATVVTATVDEPLDGSLGCQAEDLPAEDCFGLQPELTLRLAVIDSPGGTLISWLRHDGSADSEGASDEFAEFEEMLQSIEFQDREPVTPSPSTGTAASEVDGVWTTSFSRKKLASSPLLYEPDEVNDQNWGAFTLTLDHGKFSFEQENPRDSYSSEGTFTVDGDVLSLSLDNLEQFDMHFTVEGDTLTLVRDESLGIAPTPFVLQPWKR